MGIDDFLDGVGDVIGKINRWTSLSPGGFEQKPVFQISGSGVKFNGPGQTANVTPEAKAEGLNVGIESAMEGMRWLYSNGISQPIATAALVGKLGRRGNNDAFGFDKDYFSASNWAKAWRAANHISAGQALMMNPEEAENSINSPLLYYKPPDAYLPPGFKQLPEDQQQKILQDAGMPAVGNQYVEKMRGNSSWFKYGTGALDFASVTFLDPTVLAGGAIGRARSLSVIKKAPKGGWSTAEVDQIMSSSKMKTLRDGIWANRDNPQLINNTPLAQHSGMGPRFGATVAKLNDPDELDLFIRTGMGDMRALDELNLRNGEAALRMSSDWSRLNGLDLMRSRYANSPNILGVVDSEMKRLNGQIASDQSLVQRYDEILSQADLLDELHINRNSMEIATNRTAAQNAYRAGGARGAANRPISFTVGTRSGFQREITGYAHNRLWGAGDYFSGPVTMIRAIKNAHPNGYMRLDVLDKDSINELRGHLARIPNIKDSTRGQLLNDYLKTTTEAERKDLLETVGRLGAAKVANKYGLTPEDGLELYKKHLTLKQGEIDNMERYSAALRSPEDVAAGQPLHIDEFTTDGGKITLSPFTVTRLMNGHTFQDLGQLDKWLSRESGRLKTLKLATGNTRDALEAMADYSSYLWKFSTLWRLGYIPRVLGDDLGSQWARAGTAAMALRTGRGIKNAFHNIALTQTRPALEARQQNALNGVQYADEEMAHLAPQIKRLDTFLKADAVNRQNELRRATQLHAASEARVSALSPGDVTAKAKATRTLHVQRQQQLTQAQARVSAGASPGKQQALADMKNQHDFLSRYRDLSQRSADDYALQQQKVIQGNQPIEIDGKVFPAAFSGKSGEYHMKLVSADESVGNIFATNKQLVQGNLERSFDHGAKPISAAQDAKLHLQAWTHAINNQIMQDPLSRMAVKGASAEEMAKWLKQDARGMAYRARLPKMLNTDDIAQSAKYEVDQYLHTPEIRMKALEPDGVSPDFLEKAAPNIVDRPDVHVGQVGQSQLRHANALDRVIQKWFKVAATMPANRMSRHPLFNQFYEGHLKRIVTQRTKQIGHAPNWTVDEVENMAHSARQLALRDTRNLVFDIAHRSDAAAALRFISPFFSATAESFQRWGRVIADRPQIVGYGANWYNSPAYLGKMQDLDGNTINSDGYTYIPMYPLKADGTPDYTKKPTVIKRQVPKSERYIVTRVPKWVARSPIGKAFNITEAGGKLALSQNSIDVITQGDPWFNPGVGPVVQIPVNEFVKDKPRTAELARHLGILPFGPATGNPAQRVLQGAAPATLRNLITAFDTSDQRYQQIKLQILQREIYNYTQGDPDHRPPTQAQIGLMEKAAADKTRNYWLFSASSSFLQPFATQRKDPFQFYRDQFNNLRRQNPLTADDEFLKRYGESYFTFAQEITKSSGVPPTMRAVELAKKYGKELAQYPDLAALIIGPEGNGPFSPEAYAYELNNPLVPGGSEMMRTKISADEAVKENQRRLGWAKYTKQMNKLGSQLRAAGFSSFDDAGAEDFKTQKKAWTSLYAEPLYPDGSVNPYYNEQWSKDFFSLDARKYERMIPGLTALARSDLSKLPQRTDLRTLQQYLGGRQALIGVLNQRQKEGLDHTLSAQANADLRQQWASFVDGLIESDTRFGDLYHRYLARDLGVDVEEEASQ